jgi:hypothetical protein
MKYFRARHLYRLTLCTLLLFAALALSACGGDEDPCAGVTCDFGVCGSNGQCTNSSTCEVDDDCVPGYECGAESSCEALAECSDDSDCAAGVCDGDACVNPSSCDSNDDCRARTFCGPDDTCEPDPCNDIGCQRGVCQRGTVQCVSADSCTPDTELLDCVAGEKCAGGSCQPADSFCDDITCERGVCSFDAGGCTDADNCEGDSANCTEGSFCNDQDQCQPDLCEQNNVECPNGGVCVEALGECQNATSCDSSDECLSGHLCVEGTCRLAGVACGDASGDGGCPGNQVCDFDDTDLTATCAEPDVCQTSLDCTGERQCGGQDCLDPVTCSDDYFEPNDSQDEATLFTDVATSQTLSASVCSGDVDFFSFDTADLGDASSRGTLLVQLDVPLRDVGLGQLDVTLRDADGNELTSGSTRAGGTEHSVRLEESIGIPDHGEYAVEVSAADDMSAAGVRYDLSVNVMPDDAIAACDAATPIRVNQRISGTTEDAPSNHLGSSCTSDPNSANEVVYALELDAPQEVSFELSPQLSSTDLSMSLRSRCTQAASESACVNATAEGEGETMTALLGAGTHYLIVQAADEGAGGPFELVVQTIYTACAPGDDYCADADTAQVCARDGGRFLSVDCDAGCNPTTGFCEPPAGDACFDAPVIDGDATHEISLVQTNNNYELSDASCFDEAAARSGGPEQTYRVELPAETAFTAQVSFAGEAEGSLYVVEDCADLDSSCLVGASDSMENANQETLTHANLSTDPQTLYLVVDTRDDQALSSAQLEVTFDPVVCQPAATRCHPDDDQATQICNDYGTGFEHLQDCGGWGCASDVCLTPNDCGSALDVTTEAKQTGGATYTLNWDHFTDDFSGPACGLTNFEMRGTDGVVRVDLEADEVLFASLDQGSGTWDPSLILATDCSDFGNSCLDSNEVTSGAAEIAYLASSPETVYLIANNDDSGTQGDFTLDVEVVDSECSPATDAPRCLDSNDIEYCDSYGTWRPYSCDGGCANDACGTPQGQFCFDAITLNDGDSDTQTYTGEVAIDVPGGTAGSCDFSSAQPQGPDHIYAIPVTDGDVVTANYETGINESPSSFGTMYFLDTCGDINSCTANGGTYPTTGVSTLSTTATQTGTIYLVVARTLDFPDDGYDYEVTIDIN